MSLLMTLVEEECSKLKDKISEQSKNNFLLEKEVKYLDDRIALLVKNKLAGKDVGTITFHPHLSDS